MSGEGEERGMLLRRQAISDEYQIPERCTIVEMWSVPEDDDASVARCRVSPGVTTQLHSLPITERYVVETGTGIMEIGGKDPFRLAAGDGVLIPPGAPQRIRNDGEDDLVFLAICSPAFKMHHYRNLEEDAPLPPIGDLEEQGA